MKFDPIEMELFKNSFLSIADEMGAVLGRTALSPNIKERKDFSCALFTKDGETFAQGTHIPVHLGAMPLSVKAAIEHIDFREGDAVLVNDPYKGGTHLPDITCISPVFYEGKLLYFSANRAHHSDVGGMTPGSMPLATEIFQEGIIIPPVRIVSQGTLNEDLFGFFLANVRTPDERSGDILAQIAANKKGASRLIDIIREKGLEKILKYTSLIQEYVESILRKVLSQIPDGVYKFNDCMDDDGISDNKIEIKVSIKVNGNSAEIDFTGSSPQTEGGVNANYAVTTSAVLYVFRSLIEEDIPINSGLMKPLNIVAPTGSIVNASFPAATAGGNVETSQRIVDSLLGALSKAIPKKIPAASQGTMNNIAIGGFDTKNSRPFAYYETIGGGAGGSSVTEGMSGVHTHMTNSLNTPVEALEKYLPMRIAKYCLRRNSGGCGEQRGGDGIIREYELLERAEVTIISERRRTAPWGIKGGSSGKTGKNILITGDGEKKLPSKCNLKLKPGERIRIETPGGGGYGKKN
jgi:N-methylhydantoinase B/oxoprolinase/acetone carboxylase alpha subunit